MKPFLLITALLLGLYLCCTEPEEDFTDTGVGCTDDCLEPADDNDERTTPERWEV